MRIRIDFARFRTIVRPISRNPAGLIDAIERLRLNQVPQRTPETNAKRKMLRN